MLSFTWFYSSDSGLFNGLQRFQIRFSSSPVALSPGARLAPRAFGSGYGFNVGRLLVFTRGDSKNCVASLSGFLFRPPLRWVPLAQGAIAQSNANAMRANAEFRFKKRPHRGRPFEPRLRESIGSQRETPWGAAPVAYRRYCRVKPHCWATTLLSQQPLAMHSSLNWRHLAWPAGVTRMLLPQ
jgi:hypothetical protein